MTSISWQLFMVGVPLIQGWLGYESNFSDVVNEYTDGQSCCKVQAVIGLASLPAPELASRDEPQDSLGV